VVLLIALRNEDESLRFFIHPEWRTLVQQEDLTYIEDLLRDFLDRAETDSEDLFKQITSLGEGPLTTQEVGLSLDDHSVHQQLLSGFVEL
jgi:hypothetical protein